MYSDAKSLHTNLWLDEWRQFMTTSEAIQFPSNLRNRLVDPIKLGDPVFCVALCKELVKREEISILIKVLGDMNPSKKRIILCEMIFYFCKCPATECRLYIASSIPLLLWSEWILNGLQNINSKEESLEEDLSAIEAALLACYHQECNIAPLPPSIRVCGIKTPSIYNNSIETTEMLKNENVPFTHQDDYTITTSNSTLYYPTHPPDKFDDYSRKLVTYRLCRYFQDYIPEMDNQIIAVYGLLIAQLSTLNTKIRSQEFLQNVQTGAIFSFVRTRDRFATNRLSDLNLTLSGLDLVEDQIQPPQNTCLSAEISLLLFDLFSPPIEHKKKRKYPVTEDLVVLWCETLDVFEFKFPLLEELVRDSLLRRSRISAFSKALLALSF